MTLQLNRQTTLVSVTSGALSIAGYLLVKKFVCGGKCSSGESASTKTAVAITTNTKAKQSAIYEDKELVDQYMMFNYAEGKEMLQFITDGENAMNEKLFDVRECFLFPKRVALLCRDHCPDLFFSDDGIRPRNALDIGCAVGRSCLELSKLFESVVGIDYSAAFIEQCQRVVDSKGKEPIEYSGRLEGDLFQDFSYKVDHDANLDRCKFEVGDACHLREDLGEFNLVLASNLVCRLTEPKLFLDRLKKLVKSRGYAVLSTPFTWGEQYTPKQNWLGGKVDSATGKELTSFEGMRAELEDTFELVKETQLPMFIRETRRKFQYTICLVSIWQKK